MRKSKSGFTIVELLIVIVIIGILAAITVVAYQGITGRTYDSRRINDAKSIVKALELYKVDKGFYPVVAYSGLGSQQGWESSAREANGEFIKPLVASGFITTVPIDPINNATDDTTTDAQTNKKYGYNYHVYTAGNSGCDTSRGKFFVFGIISTATKGISTHPDSPGFSCSGRNWQSGYSWVTGGYEN